MRKFFVLSSILASCLSVTILAHIQGGYSLASWQLSEWLINYAGGFVRRGLPGEGIALLSKLTNTSPYWWALAVSLGSLIALMGIVIRKAKSRFYIYIILSPVLLGGAVLGNSWFRKDFMGLLCLIACLKVLFDMTRYSDILRMILVNSVCIVMLLCHEAYGFYALALLIMINAASVARRQGRALDWMAMATSLIQFGPSIACFLLALVCKGDQTVARKIHQSWSDHIFPFVAKCVNPDKPTAAIEAIGWSTREGVDASLSVLKAFSYGIYVPFAWLVTMYVTAGFIIGAVKPDSQDASLVKSGADSKSNSIKTRSGCEESARSSRLLCCLSLQLFAIAPLFVFGWDFGRWILFWALGAVIFYLYTPDEVIDVMRRNMLLTRYSIRRQWLRNWDPVYLLIFAIPPCSWTVLNYVKYTPIVRSLWSMWQLVAGVSASSQCIY